MKLKIYHRYNQHLGSHEVQKICASLQIKNFSVNLDCPTQTEIDFKDSHISMNHMVRTFDKFNSWSYNNTNYIGVKVHNIKSHNILHSDDSYECICTETKPNTTTMLNEIRSILNTYT